MGYHAQLYTQCGNCESLSADKVVLSTVTESIMKWVESCFYGDLSYQPQNTMEGVF